ncbi:hypothetical protein K4L44_02845 [Halosquirtibacter laminarini]|uniref:Uncharacterized protein n=1 Tax=Halosquirtibacter laminarini TaxID=3374600 RepID=A0AC61NGP9_9BACT|nr:hypothetical protein K4L44_02845 [Prolixibacteraceae bacterium]
MGDIKSAYSKSTCDNNLNDLAKDKTKDKNSGTKKVNRLVISKNGEEKKIKCSIATIIKSQRDNRNE